MLAEKFENKEVCLCVYVCGIQLKYLGDDWMEGFIPFPPLPKEREQESGQKHLWPMTPVITPTLPVIQGLSSQRTMEIWCQHPVQKQGEMITFLPPPRGHQGFCIPCVTSPWGKLPGV